MDSERVARYGRAATRWGKLVVGGRARPGLRVFYGWDRIPAPGEQVAGGTAKLQKLAERWPNHPTDFSLLYLGTTYLPRDLRPLLWLARKRARGSSSTRTASPTRAGRATGQTSSTRRSVARCSRPTTSSTRARSASVPRTSSSVSRADRGRSCRTRSTSSASRLAHRRSTARSCCSGATRRRPTGSSSASRRSGTSSTSTRARASSSAAPRLRSGADTAPPRAPRRSRLPRRVHAGRRTRRLPPRARPAPHEGQRSVPDDGDRGDGMRRPGRVRRERRDSGARRGRGGHRRPA